MKKISVILLIFVSVLLAQGEAKAQSIGLRIPDTTAVRGTFMDIPLYVDSTLTGKNVYSYTLRINYSTYYLQPVSVSVDGTIGAAFGTPVYNLNVPGYISIAAAGAEPLSGSGKLLTIRFKVIGCCGTYIYFDNASQNFFNEGSPAISILKRGYLSIQNPPTLSISPDNKIIAKGEQVQMSVWNGTAPYYWSVTDTTVASIDSLGLLTAKNAGFTRVVAIDTLGVTDTTSVFEVRPFRLSFPDDLTQWEDATIDIPVMCSDLTGLGINSGTFQVQYSSSILQPVGVVQDSTLLSASQVQFNYDDTRVTVAFAGSSDLAGSGTLVKIRFKVNQTNYSGNYLYFKNVLFNEDMLAAVSDGYFRVKNFASRYLSPSQKNILVGDSLSYNIYGSYILPLHWSVDDSTVAHIDQTGKVHALKRGNVTVTAVDSVGAPASADLSIFDTRVFMNDTSVCTFENLIEYPVYMQQVPVYDSVYAVEGTIYFDSTRISYKGYDMDNCALNGWMSSVNYSNGQIKFAFSSSTALKSAGKLFNIKLQPKSNFDQNSWVGIRLIDIKFNEGVPSILYNDPYQTKYISGQVKTVGQVSIWTEGYHQYCEGDTIWIYSNLYNFVNPQFTWFKNDTVIQGQTQSYLKLANLKTNDSIYCRVRNFDPCAQDSVNISNKLGFIVGQKPVLQPGIMGDTVVVINSTGTYKVQPVPNVEFYQWELSEGAYGTSYADSINIQFGDMPGTVTLRVFIVNECGMSNIDSLRITVIDTTGVKVSLEDTYICTFDQLVESPVYLEQVPENDSVYAVHGTIAIDTTKIAYAGVNNHNCALSGWEPSVSYIDGVINFAFTSSVALNSAGRLFNIQLQPKAGFDENTKAGIRITSFIFNDGTPHVQPSTQESYIAGMSKVIAQLSIWTEGYDQYCEGDTVTIYSHMFNFVNPQFTWFRNDSVIPGETGSLIKLVDLVTGDSVYCKVRNYDPCALDTVSVSNKLGFVIGQKPVLTGIIGDTIVAKNSTKTYRVDTVPGVEFYEWDLPEGLSGFSDSASIEIQFGDTTGTFTIRVFTMNQCGMSNVDSLQILVKDSVTYYKAESADKGIKIYPNPVSNDLFIKIPASFGFEGAEIIDLTGKKIDLITKFTGHVLHYQMKDIPKGIYFVRVRGSATSAFFRIIKR